MIAGFCKGWSNNFNSPLLAQLCTQRNQSATKSVLQVQVAYCPKLLLNSTGNALEKDRLIQQTQQKESAAFSHTQLSQTQMAAYKWERPFSQRSTNHCIYNLPKHTQPRTELWHCFYHKQQAHYTPQILMVLVLGGIFSKWKLQITSDAVSPLHLINMKHQESPWYWDAQNY